MLYVHRCRKEERRSSLFSLTLFFPLALSLSRLLTVLPFRSLHAHVCGTVKRRIYPLQVSKKTGGEVADDQPRVRTLIFKAGEIFLRVIST